jgi:hypothetical protein
MATEVLVGAGDAESTKAARPSPWASLLVVPLCCGLWSGAAQAEPRDFDDCSGPMQKTLRARLFDSKGRVLPLFFTRDAVHYSVCVAASDPRWRRLRAAMEGGLYVTESQQVAAVSNSPMARAAREACFGTDRCKAEIFRREGYQPQRQVFEFSTSGGLPFARFLGHLGKAGHYEITARALQTDSGAWSAKAVEIMTDAARDADFFEWRTAAAHAQTANDDAGLISQGRDIAQRELAQWMQKYLEQAGQACAAGSSRQALYLLGYVLHAVQDLAFHEGITNAEHSYRDNILDEQVDTGQRYDEKFRLTVQASKQLLTAFSAPASRAQCLPAMMNWKGGGALSSAGKRALLSRSRDFTVLQYFAYSGLADKVDELLHAANPREEQIFIGQRWIVEPRAQSLESLLDALLLRP